MTASEAHTTLSFPYLLHKSLAVGPFLSSHSLVISLLDIEKEIVVSQRLENVFIIRKTSRIDVGHND